MADEPGRERVAAIILAAGKSRRMGGQDKLLLKLKGVPLLSMSLEVFQRSSSVDEIYVVTNEENFPEIQALVTQRGWGKVKGICLGGERRQDSAKEGLKRAAGCSWVIIHDAARPFVTDDLIIRGIQKARTTGAAIPAVPVADTLKQVDDRGVVAGSVSRDGVWAIQTPQVFKYDIIWEAHNSVTQDVTDDASLLEILGRDVSIYEGSPFNIKVTGPQDMELAEAIARFYESRHGV